MTHLKSVPGERICDLVDGRLPDGEGALALASILDDPQALRTWHAYHVVGDVLRSPELAPRHCDYAFLARLEQRLAQEPGRPRALEPAGALLGGVAGGKLTADPAAVANASVFRWKMLAGMACTVLVGVLGLGLWSQNPLGGSVQMSASKQEALPVPQVVAVGTLEAPMIRDPQLDELMAAHRQLGGHSALQVPAGFLRNATYAGSSR